MPSSMQITDSYVAGATIPMILVTGAVNRLTVDSDNPYGLIADLVALGSILTPVAYSSAMHYR